jgi:hypothetical protein
VCTVACTVDTACTGADEPRAACTEIDGDTCGGTSKGAVCLQTCEREAECEDELSCVAGTCRQRTGEAADSDASTRPGVGTSSDAGVLHGAEDASTIRDAALDAAVEPAVPRELGEACDVGPGCGGGLSCERGTCQMPWSGLGCEPAQANRPACVGASCFTGALCHIDGTCIVPGKCDARGETTLAEVGIIVAMQLTHDSVYLLSEGTKDSLGNVQDDGAIQRVAIGGGAPESLVTGLRNSVPERLQVDRDRLFWVTETFGASGSIPELWSAARADGANPTLLASDVVGFTQDLTHLYYLHDSPIRNLSRVEKSSGAPELLGSVENEPVVVLVDSQAAYVLGAALWTVPLAGGTAAKIQDLSFNTAVQTRTELLSMPVASFRIQSVPKVGGEVLNLGGPASGLLVAHRDHVYFAATAPWSESSSVEADFALGVHRVPRVPGVKQVLTVEFPATPATRMALAVSDQGLFWSQEGRLVRKVISDYYPTPTPAQGDSGGPCFGDLTCNGTFSCVDTLCE